MFGKFPFFVNTRVVWTKYLVLFASPAMKILDCIPRQSFKSTFHMAKPLSVACVNVRLFAPVRVVGDVLSRRNCLALMDLTTFHFYLSW